MSRFSTGSCTGSCTGFRFHPLLVAFVALLVALAPQFALASDPPFRIFRAGIEITADDIYDLGERIPGQTLGTHFWVRSDSAAPLDLSLGAISVDGTEYEIPAGYDTVIPAYDKSAFGVWSTGVGGAGTITRTVRVEIDGAVRTFRVRSTQRHIEAPCDLNVRLPAVPTQPALWWQDDLYPNCNAAWWTLSDDLAPADLRDAWLSAEEHQARYRAAPEVQERIKQSGDDSSEVSFYISGARNPELIPMWKAFAVWAEELSDRSFSETPRESPSRGLFDRSSPLDFQRAARLAGSYERAAQPEVAWDTRQMREVSRLAQSQMGGSAFRDAIEQGQVQALAAAAGLDEAEFLEMLRRVHRNLSLESSVAQLEELLQELPVERWLQLRQYLLEEVAPRIVILRRAPVGGAEAAGFDPDDGPIPGDCPWFVSNYLDPVMSFVFQAPIYSLKDSTSGVDPTSKQEISFRHRARWEGPTSMLGCHKFMTVGCRLNHTAETPYPAITNHSNWDFQDQTGFGGQDVLIEQVGQSALCHGIDETIPRCVNGAANRFHGWVSAIVSTGLPQTWGFDSPAGQSGIGVADCISLVSISGPIQGLPANRVVGIQANIVAGPADSAPVGASASGSSYRIDGIPADSTIDLEVSNPPSGVQCSFPEGQGIQVGENGINGIALECCQSGAPDCGDPLKVGFSASGVGDKVLAARFSVGGSSLSRNVGEDGFHLLSNEDFPPGTPWNLSEDPVLYGSNKVCVASETGGTVGPEANFAGNAYRLTTITCTCPNGAATCADSSFEGELDPVEIVADVPTEYRQGALWPSGGHIRQCTVVCEDEEPETTWECEMVEDSEDSDGGLTEVCTLVETESKGECECNDGPWGGPEASSEASVFVLPGGGLRLDIGTVATDPDGIAGFFLLLDDQFVTSSITSGGHSASFQHSLDISGLSPGNHVARVIPMDADPNGQLPSIVDHAFSFTIENPTVGDAAEVVAVQIPTTLACGEGPEASVTLRNAGSTTWSRNLPSGGHKFGWRRDEGNPLADQHRVWLPEGVTVAPGASHTFPLPLRAPLTAGTYTTEWQMVREGLRWFGPTVSRGVQVSCADLEVAALRDAWVAEDNPDAAHWGFSEELRVRKTLATGFGRHSFLTFQVPALSGPILGAKLRIRAQETPIPEAGFYQVLGFSWSEGAVTWNNWHLGGAFHDYLRSGWDIQPNGWIEIDVSEAVNGPGLVHLGIASGIDRPDQDFWSRHSAHPPTLVISYAP